MSLPPRRSSSSDDGGPLKGADNSRQKRPWLHRRMMDPSVVPRYLESRRQKINGRKSPLVTDDRSSISFTLSHYPWRLQTIQGQRNDGDDKNDSNQLMDMIHTKKEDDGPFVRNNMDYLELRRLQNQNWADQQLAGGLASLHAPNTNQTISLSVAYEAFQRGLALVPHHTQLVQALRNLPPRASVRRGLATKSERSRQDAVIEQALYKNINDDGGGGKIIVDDPKYPLLRDSDTVDDSGSSGRNRREERRQQRRRRRRAKKKRSKKSTHKGQRKRKKRRSYRSSDDEDDLSERSGSASDDSSRHRRRNKRREREMSRLISTTAKPNGNRSNSRSNRMENVDSSGRRTRRKRKRQRSLSSCVSETPNALDPSQEHAVNERRGEGINGYSSSVDGIRTRGESSSSPLSETKTRGSEGRRSCRGRKKRKRQDNRRGNDNDDDDSSIYWATKSDGTVDSLKLMPRKGKQTRKRHSG
jgi:hypothetical protein